MLTAFLFPVLLASIGTRVLLDVLVITSIVGGAVTWMFRIETTGVSLDRMGEDPMRVDGGPQVSGKVNASHRSSP